MMKLRFEPDLDFQLQAVDAVCDLFRGQETCRTEFTVTRSSLDAQERLAFARNDLGVGNRLTLLDDEILANLKDIQLRNGLPPSGSLESGDFTVEMETGTGKTYVRNVRCGVFLSPAVGWRSRYIVLFRSWVAEQAIFRGRSGTLQEHARARARDFSSAGGRPG